jgi:alkylation response protein AidB-like acyl-CoA dehydrogenase
MDLEFTPVELNFRQEVRRFARTNLPRDIWEKVDRGIELSHGDYARWMKILSDKGWVASNWEAKDGGPGFSIAEKYIFDQEIFLAGAPRIIHFGTRMVGPVLLAYGTPEQKRKYLPKILTSEEIWCQGYSEPGAGSDLASLQLAAGRDGDHYVLNGTKIWTSHAHYADRMFALVRTGKEGKKQEGISVLLIDLKTPGITIQPIITIDGRHHFNQVFFENARVAVEDRIGAEGEGWTIAKYLLGHERSNASWIAINRRMFAKLQAIAAEERVGGGRLIDNRDFRRQMDDLEIELQTLELTSLRALASAAADKPVGAEASMLKLRTAEVHKRVAELMMEAGAYYAQPFNRDAIRQGWNEEPIGPDYLFRMTPDYLEARAMSIAGGSNEVQKNVLAKHILGL